MKLSKRAKRMEQHHRRAKRNPGLQLVSLMDIFTILVFFLLVSSTEVQDIPSTKAVTLPESISLDKPKDTLTLIVTPTTIVLRDETVATIDQVNAQTEDVIPALKRKLDEIAQLREAVPVAGGEDGAVEEYELMIMGDREIPYKVLRRIIATATEAKYNRISLAVVQKTNVSG